MSAIIVKFDDEFFKLFLIIKIDSKSNKKYKLKLLNPTLKKIFNKDGEFFIKKKIILEKKISLKKIKP